MPVEQDLLSIGFDYKQTQADAEKVVASMKSVLEYADKFSSLKDILSSSGGFAQSKKGANELSAALKEGSRIADDYNKKLIATEKALQQEAKTRQENLKAIQEQEKAEQQAIKTDKLREDQAKRTAAALKQKADSGTNIPFTSNLSSSGTIVEPTQGATTGAIVSDLEKLQVEGIITAKEYAAAQRGISASFAESNQAAAVAIVTEKELQAAKIAVQKANSENNVSLQGYKLQQQEATKAAKEEAAAQLGIDTPASQARKKQMIAIQKAERDEVLAIEKAIKQKTDIQAKEAVIEDKITKELSNDYKQLSLAYNEAALKSKNLALQQGANSPAAKSALLEANALGAKLKEVDGLTGTFNRNVGNYAGAVGGAFKSAFGFLRTAANILPGIGISGLILLATDALSDLVTAAMNGEKALNRISEGHKNYIDTLNEAAHSSAKEIVDLRVLEKAATDVSKPMSIRTEAVKDLKKEYPQYLANLSNEAILNGEAAKQIDLVAGALYKKALAEAASSKAAGIAGSQLDLELRRNFLIQRQQIVTKQLSDATKEFNDQLAKTPKDQQKFLVNSDIGKAQIELAKLNQLLHANGEQATFNAAQMKFFTDKAAENIDATLSLEKADKAKKGVKTISDAVSELRKELAAIKGKVDIGELAPKDADIERVKAYDKAFEDIFKRGAKANTPIVQELVVELKPINERVLKAQLQDFAEKVHSEAKIQVPLEVDTARRDLIIKNTSDAVQKIVDSNDDLYAKDLENLNKSLIDKKISQDEYNKAIDRLQKDHIRTEITNAIELNQAIIDNLKARGFDVTEYERKLTAQRQKLYELDAKGAIEADNKKKKSAEDLHKAKSFLQEKEIQLGKELASLGSTLVEASIENQKNKLQELEDLQQKNYENQVERINSSTLTDTQKADQLNILEKQRQAQKDKNDREQRELDTKKAKFERLVAMANIVAATATAEVQALTYLSNPITAPLYPSIAATIAAIGAVQLAALLARPIPKYATGTQDHPGGLAEVGEGQYKELVEMPGGKSFIADRSMVVDLPKHTKVTPITNNEINKIMYRGMMTQTAATVQPKNDMSEMILRDIHKELKKNNGKKVQVNTRIKFDTTWETYRKNYYS